MPETASPRATRLETLLREHQAAVQDADTDAQLKSLQALSACYEQQGRFAEAAESLEKACEIAEAREAQGMLAKLLNRLGGVLQRQNRFDEAISVLQESRNLARSRDDQHRLGKILNGLGSVLRRQGWVEESIELFEQSYTLLAELDVPGDQIVVLANLASMYQKQKKIQESQETFQRCLEMSEELGDRRYLAYIYTAMGKAFLDGGDLEQALYVLGEAFDLDEDIPHLNGLHIVLPNLIDTLHRLEQSDKAAAYRQRALALAPDDPHFRVCVRRGQPGRADSAEGK